MRDHQSSARHHRAEADKLEQQMKNSGADKPSKNAAKELKAELEAKGAAKASPEIKHKHPAFTMKDKAGNMQFHDYETGAMLDNYQGAFHPNGIVSETMHTWIDEDGNRAYGAQDPKVKKLIDGVHKVGMDLLDNDAVKEHHENIKNKLRGLKDNPTAKAAAQVAGDLKLIADNATQGQHKVGDTVQNVINGGDEKTVKYDSHDLYVKELGEIHKHLFDQGYQPYRHPGRSSFGDVSGEPGVKWSQKQYRKGLHYINVRHTGRASRGENEITITRHNI